MKSPVMALLMLVPKTADIKKLFDMTAGDDGSFEAGAVARTPLARTGQPEDIAKVAAFLASDEAGWSPAKWSTPAASCKLRLASSGASPIGGANGRLGIDDEVRSVPTFLRDA